MQAAVFFLILAIIQLDAGATPNFLKEPTSRSAIKGSHITFECQIDVLQASYHWLKDGSNITKGSISLSGSLSSLLVNNLEFSDAGNYSCVAVDKQSGQRGERTGLLAVKGKPTILQAPSVLFTYTGQFGMFHCITVGDPKPIVRWKNSSSAIITTHGRFEVFSNGSLKISNLQKSDDGGLFICEAENLYGTTAASTTLRVNDPPSLPSFTWKPVNRTAVEGGRETFYCTATGSPSPTITWSKLGGSIPADRRQEPSPGSLRIIDLQPGDDGIYICTASNFLGNVTAQAFLHIQGYPRITTGPSNKVITENSSIQLTCIIEGDPTPHVEWTTPKGTKLTLLSQPSGTIRVLANNSLSITMVTEKDAGRYTCTAVNSIGQRSISATLTVLAPPRFSTPLVNRTQNINSQLFVECGANAVPVPDYHWLFNSSVITRQRSLNLSSVSLANQGFYACIANNSLGSVQGRFYLTIQVPPVFVKSPKNQTIPKGQTASFPCSATGDPAPSITWYKSSDPISSNAHLNVLSNGTLVVNSVTEQESGWFTCHATNEAGMREARAYLLVADYPVFTTIPINTTVEEGSSATLSCHANGPRVVQYTQNESIRLR